MKTFLSTRNLRMKIIVDGILLLFISGSCFPSLAERMTASQINSAEKTSEGDIPTWYLGDEWIYTIDPLYYSSPNGSFSGTIENFKQKVVSITDGMYEIEITGDISGDLSMSAFTGECNGDKPTLEISNQL